MTTIKDIDSLIDLLSHATGAWYNGSMRPEDIKYLTIDPEADGRVHVNVFDIYPANVFVTTTNTWLTDSWICFYLEDGVLYDVDRDFSASVTDIADAGGVIDIYDMLVL